MEKTTPQVIAAGNAGGTQIVNKSRALSTKIGNFVPF